METEKSDNVDFGCVGSGLSDTVSIVTSDTFSSGIVPEPTSLLSAAIMFRDAAFAYLNALDGKSVCSKRTCLACRIADAAFDVEKKHGLTPQIIDIIGG